MSELLSPKNERDPNSWASDMTRITSSRLKKARLESALHSSIHSSASHSDIRRQNGNACPTNDRWLEKQNYHRRLDTTVFWDVNFCFAEKRIFTTKSDPVRDRNQFWKQAHQTYTYMSFDLMTRRWDEDFTLLTMIEQITTSYALRIWCRNSKTMIICHTSCDNIYIYIYIESNGSRP